MSSVISPSTQIEMYKYLAKHKESGVREIDTDSNDFITSAIKDSAIRLSKSNNLFIKTAEIKSEGNKVKINSKYNSKSNHIIYYALHNIGGCNKLLEQVNKEKHLAITFKNIPENYEDIIENSGKLRNKLIHLCKIYLNSKEYEIASQINCTDKEFMAKESWLAEASLHKYTKEYSEEIGYDVIGNLLRGRNKYTYALKSDIIIEDILKTIIIDVKVYSNIISKDGLYISNANRYQVNSYIGAYLDREAKKGKEIEENKVEGILLHIVDNAQYEKVKQMNGANLSVEDGRKLTLYIIEDKGLNYIFDEYSKILDKHLNEEIET